MNVSDVDPESVADRRPDTDGELGLLGEIVASFRGRHRWLMIAVWGETLAFLGLTIFATVRFFDAVTLREHVGWATLAAVAFTSMVAVKIWYHNWLNRSAVLRQVKRLEREIAQLRTALRSNA